MANWHHRERRVTERLSSHQRGYGADWRKLRLVHLRANPLCVFCLRKGITKAANVVDHIIPHKMDNALRLDPGNLQSLCKPCHDGEKQQSERNGYSFDIGLDGWPLDPKHPANQKG